MFSSTNFAVKNIFHKNIFHRFGLTILPTILRVMMVATYFLLTRTILYISSYFAIWCVVHFLLFIKLLMWGATRVSQDSSGWALQSDSLAHPSSIELS